MRERIPSTLRKQIRDRASGRCEYCLLHEEESLLPYEADHIISIKHGGQTEELNLAWSCFICNRSKGSDLSSIDSATGDLVRLFHPRLDAWSDHFQVGDDMKILARTAVGRVTAGLLKFNLPDSVELRKSLNRLGRYP